ncbi:hypothetical protein SEA_VIBAKI_72 [Arthrobacter phage Vibaki]|uniref:Helix-turn-helix DNA binding domain protein n=1 Tax=Arthrobacter phage Vibaki TaxID=2593333 RepID=A0A514TZ24_9CAUD|nr:hypothetical protein HYP95_gp72 [Arthrobacter phage Vibaki]QDK01952.1 hypothetical protein SEA_VIBAKI_72 [Arthrobacter phage Vibaki]
MTRTTTCDCDAPHVERVELSPLHILGAGGAWRAARPGGVYLAGHGYHFETEQAARDYAFGPQRQPGGDIRYLLDLGLTVDEIAHRAGRTPKAITAELEKDDDND